MLIHDDIYSWKGWGGVFKLAAGRCRLRIYDLSRDENSSTPHLKPIVVIVSDLPSDEQTSMKSVSVRSCSSHIATCVVKDFNLDPTRMTFIEYYPATTYGDRRQHTIEERYDVVDLQWHGQKALHPQWRPLRPPLLDLVKELIIGEKRDGNG